MSYKLFDLYELDFNINNICVIGQNWCEGQAFSYMQSPRNECGIIYFNDSDGEYTFNDSEPIYAKRGDIAFLPKDSFYKTKFSDVGKSKYKSILINFQITDSGGKPIYLDKDISVFARLGYSYNDAFFDALNAYNAFVVSQSKIKAFLYELIFTFSKSRLADKFDPCVRNISNGILFLENNYLTDISVRELSEMCYVSTDCFTRLFKIYSGKTPKEYILDKKIERAKQLLKSNALLINEISDRLGFYSPAYFSRLFKNKTGVSPMEYMKL